MKNRFRFLKDSHFPRNGYVLAKDGTLKIRHGVGAGDRKDWHSDEPSCAEAIENAIQHRQYTSIKLGADFETRRTLASQLLEEHLNNGSKENAFSAIHGLMPSGQVGSFDADGAKCDKQQLLLVAKHEDAPMGYLVLDVQHEHSNETNEMRLSLTVDQLYVAPSFQDKAVGIDLFIACGWLSAAITRATVASMQTGGTLSTLVAYEVENEQDDVCLSILVADVEECLLPYDKKPKGINVARLEVIHEAI
ncbi:hypothetical protein QU487_06360 [Crenobacter sp. SG2305]|uniref:hypothetical protein n=1 Tax=Crenobacter oryzisoli TaxID=3056844 RepID=UPI0025AA8D80|nr:hypothetical protein [Crenobacter sp. SG2305]MDN0082375.1 hypothetical protein [Crenobacter sp. SG2305]